MWWVAVFAGDDEGCVRFHAPHLGPGFRRGDCGEEGFETSSLHPGHVPLMKSAARSAMASTVRLRFARTVSGMIEASMMRSPSTP